MTETRIDGTLLHKESFGSERLIVLRGSARYDIHKFRVHYQKQSDPVHCIRVQKCPSAGHEITHLLWNSKIRYCVHSILSKFLLILSSHLFIIFRSGLFLTDLPIKRFYAISMPPMRATCFTHLIFYLINIKIGEE